MKLLSVLIVLAGLTVLASAVSIRDHREMFEDFKTKVRKTQMMRVYTLLALPE